MSVFPPGLIIHGVGMFWFGNFIYHIFIWHYCRCAIFGNTVAIKEKKTMFLCEILNVLLTAYIVLTFAFSFHLNSYFPV